MGTGRREQESPAAPAGVRQKIEELHAVNERLQADLAAAKREADLSPAGDVKYRLFFENSADGTALVDEQGIVTDWNHAEELITGLTRAEAIGRPLWDLQVQLMPDEEKRPGMAAVMRGLLQPYLTSGQMGRPGWAMERTIQRPDGERRVIQNLAFPIRTERGYMIGNIMRDITERKQSEAEQRRLLSLAESRAAELEGTLSSVADGLIIYGPRGEILRMNAEAERILGYGPAERALPIAERLAALRIETIDGRPLPVQDHPSMRALRGETVRSARVIVHGLQGRDFWVTSSAAPIRLPNNAVLGAVVTLTDVTPLHQLQEQTANLLEAEHKAREQAEAALRDRDEFLSAAAHELKTPVTNLRGYAQLTLKQLGHAGTVDVGRVLRNMTIIDRQSERLARLVAELLDLSAIESGHLSIKKEETDLAELVRAAVEHTRAGTERHPIGLHAPPTLPARLDAERIENVLVHLLENAVKFSPAGAPIEVILSEPYPRTARIEVRDHGAGIPLERRSRLFSRFYQAQPGRPFAGLGLGLYYSRQVVNLHGGQIEAEFPPEGGTRIVVNLPTET